MECDKLIELQSNGSVKLTDKGKKIAEIVWEDKEIFLFEKKFLTQLGSSMTETLVKKITGKLLGN